MRRRTRARNNRVVRLAAVAALATLVLGAGGVAVSAWAAPDVGALGALQVDPPSGASSQTNLRLTTVSTGAVAGCPATATRYSLTVTGPGAWAQGVAFNGGTSLQGSEFEVPVSPTFAAAAAVQGAALQAGRYDLRVTCTSRLGQAEGAFTGTIWFTDSDHYQSTDPATTTTLTHVSIDDLPAGRSELGEPVTLTARVVPSTATGVVQFLETVNDSPLPYGHAVPVVNGLATLVVKDFSFGLHLASASFIPADVKRFTAATSPAPELAHVVAKPIPPASSSPLLRGAS